MWLGDVAPPTELARLPPNPSLRHLQGECGRTLLPNHRGFWRARWSVEQLGLPGRWIAQVICGLLPKIGALIASMPLPVLGGGVIVMFGMVAAAGMNVLSEVKMTRRNMVIIAISLTAGLGLNLVPTAVQYLPGIWKTLATSAVAPTAFLAIVLNQILPEDME